MKTGYEDDLNHRQWLETVLDTLRQFVPAAIVQWDAQADIYNQWSALGWDERNSLVLAQAALAGN